MNAFCKFESYIIFKSSNLQIFKSSNPNLILQYLHEMNATSTTLNHLFSKIPRRHTLDNVKEIYGILTEYEDVLKNIEAENAWYEKNTADYFDEIDVVRSLVKKSTDNKASKKNKDQFFDEAAGVLKDSMQSLIEMYADGSRSE